MIRRVLTRIELKLDDINEYNSVRQPAETNNERGSSQNAPAWTYKIVFNNSAKVNERVGYAPQPHNPT
ncbi:hypothetical protein O3M35_008262 [Rhynocoris fuscipes]|uniref:Cell division cycle protein 26 homolog n=1 Tax=Rhynocoris fuscipes TaxID=488301 RepID=A0AAW1D8B5_9HEMI